MNGRMRLLAVGVPLAVLGVWPLTAATMSGAEPDVVIVQGGGDGYPTTTHGYPTTTHATTTAAPTTTVATTTTPAPPPPTLGPTTTMAPTTVPVTTISVPKKVWVCKFVGTPGVDERLQTGQNPISVSVNAIPNPPGPNVQIGDEFADAQGRSLVIGFDDGGPEPSVAGCIPIGPTTTIPATTIPATTTTIDRCPPELEPCTPGQQTTIPGTTTTTVSGTTTTSVPATTTTSVAGTATSVAATTTTIDDGFTFGAAATVCSAEVPTIRIEFQNTFPELAGEVGVLTMADVNGNVVSTQDLVYEPGTTVDLLYPGTSVNPDGSIADVPGWNLNAAGFWVRDPSDEFLREGINLTYTVNPTATAFVTYPPESSTCANPDGPFPPGTPINPITQLPFTAGESNELPPAGGPLVPIIIGIGVGLLGWGLGFRRRFS